MFGRKKAGFLPEGRLEGHLGDGRTVFLPNERKKLCLGEIKWNFSQKGDWRDIGEMDERFFSRTAAVSPACVGKPCFTPRVDPRSAAPPTLKRSNQPSRNRGLSPALHQQCSKCARPSNRPPSVTTSVSPRAKTALFARRASPLVTRSVQKLPFPPAQRHLAAQLSPALAPLPLRTQRSCSYPRPLHPTRPKHSGRAVILGRGGGRPLSRASRTPRPGDNCLHSLRKSSQAGR